MYKEYCPVIENRKIAPGHYVLRMRSPRIAKNARPGQFVQILCADSYEPLLPRPFSFLTADTKDFSILYHVVGKGTALLKMAKKGDVFSVLGPLGNGFSVKRQALSDKKEHLLVGGGVGIPPLFHLAQELLKNKISKKCVHVFLGARDKSILLCEEKFRKLGVDLQLATDNGSKGHKGYVTKILEKQIYLTLNAYRLPLKIYTCGPTPMLKTVSVISQKYEVPCEVSVEVPMACGFGACLGCAIEVRRQKTEDRKQKKQKDQLSSVFRPLSSETRFAIACTEGPVFKADEIAWD